MAQYESSYNREMSETKPQHEISGWAIGYIGLASMMMLMIGFFHFINGFAAVLDDSFYVIRPGYDLSVDVTTWGWIHMVGGIVIALAGGFLIMGAMWARVIAVLMAVVSAIWSFYSIPYYPIWSILIIALDIGVIWAVTTHGRDMVEA